MKKLLIILLLLLITNVAYAGDINKRLLDIKQTPCGIETVQLIEKYSQMYGVETKLVHAVVMTESTYKPNVHSHVGASGLMQIMPATAHSFGYSNILNKHQNLSCGIRLLKGLLTKYSGDERLALAAYNMGSPRVDRMRPNLPADVEQYTKTVLAYKRQLN